MSSDTELYREMAEALRNHILALDIDEKRELMRVFKETGVPLAAVPYSPNDNQSQH